MNETETTEDRFVPVASGPGWSFETNDAWGVAYVWRYVEGSGHVIDTDEPTVWVDTDDGSVCVNATWSSKSAAAMPSARYIPHVDHAGPRPGFVSVEWSRDDDGVTAYGRTCLFVTVEQAQALRDALDDVLATADPDNIDPADVPDPARPDHWES